MAVSSRKQVQTGDTDLNIYVRERDLFDIGMNVRDQIVKLYTHWESAEMTAWRQICRGETYKVINRDFVMQAVSGERPPLVDLLSVEDMPLYCLLLVIISNHLICS